MSAEIFEGLDGLRATTADWVAKRPGQPIPMDAPSLLDIVDTLLAAKAEADKMASEHGQSWNEGSGARILRAMGTEPAHWARQPEPGSDMEPDFEERPWR